MLVKHDGEERKKKKKWIENTFKLFLLSFPPKIGIARGGEFSNYNLPGKKWRTISITRNIIISAASIINQSIFEKNLNALMKFN